MLNDSFFYKKFSVGLAMNTNVEEFESFMKRYNKYIDNIYVSLPLGDKFHGRDYIKNQFRNIEMVELFWKLVELIKKYEVCIEVVFNTDDLTKEDFEKCAAELTKHDLSPGKICVLDWYYDIAKNIFPDVKIVRSVNCMPDDIELFCEASKRYDEVVVGRQNIRNSELFKRLKQHSEVVLLLNNGCSHICGGCNTFNYCEGMYKKAVEIHGAEKIYALQSIMPYELHSNFFDFSDISLFKLSTRNADTEFITKCIDSYISNNAEEYVKENIHNYMLWARLGWHIPHYSEFSFDRIAQYKMDHMG